jgi:hypothetical protein
LERGFVEKFMCKEVAVEVSVGDRINFSGQVGYMILKSLCNSQNTYKLNYSMEIGLLE